MDREFMEGYHDLKYPDTFMVRAMELDRHCAQLQREVMELEGQIEVVMRREGEECLQLHQKLFVAKGKLDELVMRLAYLQGAGDRERMLK